MDAIIMYLVKLYGPTAAVLVLIVVMYFDIKNLKRGVADLKQQIERMKEVMDANKEKVYNDFVLKTECAIHVKDLKEDLRRVEGRIVTLEKKYDQNTKLIIDVIKNGRA